MRLKVKELIEYLKKEDPEDEVVEYIRDLNVYEPIRVIQQLDLYKTHGSNQYAKPHEGEPVVSAILMRSY